MTTQQEDSTVKWFQMDTNAPGSPTIRRVMRKMGLEGVGALWHLWCWTGERGKLEPGRAVDEKGQPFDVEDLIDASHLSEGAFETLIGLCLETDHIDRDAWEQRRELHFTGMAKRTDEYTRRGLRSRAKAHALDLRECADTIEKCADKVEESSPTRQDNTRQDNVQELSAPVPERGQAPANGPESAAGGPSVLALFPIPPSPKAQAEDLKDYWNRATSPPIPRCQLMTDKRIRQVAMRTKEHGASKLREAVDRIEHSKFCRGETDRGQWVATIDWLLGSPDVAVKVLEGKYDNREAVARAAPVVPGRVAAAAGKYAHVGVKAGGDR